MPKQDGLSGCFLLVLVGRLVQICEDLPILTEKQLLLLQTKRYLSSPCQGTLFNELFQILDFLSHNTCLPLGVTERGMEYEFRVAGQNNIGFGQESIKYLLTPEGPPSGPPTNISHHFQTPDVVCVTWDIPLREHRNGQITHYDIEFHKKVDHTSVTDRNTTQTKVKESLQRSIHVTLTQSNCVLLLVFVCVA